MCDRGINRGSSDLIVAGHDWPMGESDDFEGEFLPRFIEAQHAFHAGDPEPNIALWTATDPVTVFGARGQCSSGTDAATETFRSAAAMFSDVSAYEWEVLAVDVHGDLAYTVAIERFTASIMGAAPTSSELRVTHVYRREDGGWRAIHRHADRELMD